MTILLEILFLLLLLLVESREEVEPCICDCRCGRKYHVPAGYGLAPDLGPGHRHGGEYGQGRDGLNPYELPSTSSSDKRLVRDGGERCQDGTYGKRDGRSQIPGGSRSGSQNGCDEWSEGSQRSNESQRDKRESIGRPLPPHLTHSVPDWDSPYLFSESNGKRAKGEDMWCKPCSKRFRSMCALHQHQAAVHHSVSLSHDKAPALAIAQTSKVGLPVFTCEICQSEFANKYAVRVHKTHEHPWSILCTECLVTFTHAQEAMDHYEDIHGSLPITYQRTQSMLDRISLKYSGLGLGSVSEPDATLAAPSPNAESSDSQDHSLLTSPAVLAPAPIVPHPVQQEQREEHFMKIYKSHTVSSNYECGECHMVFETPEDLEDHQSSPLVHGVDLTPDDFPPLSTHDPGQSQEMGPTSSPLSTDVGNRRPSVHVTTAWNQIMPSFSLDSSTDNADSPVSVTPEARLTPEPSSASSVDGTVDIELGQDEPTKLSYVAKFEDGHELTPHQRDKVELDAISICESLISPTKDDIKIPQVSEPDKGDGIQAPHDLTTDDGGTSPTSAAQVMQKQDTPTSPATSNQHNLIVGSSPAASSHDVLLATPLAKLRTSPVVTVQASPKAVFELVPSHVKIPSARAALISGSASASRIDTRPHAPFGDPEKKQPSGRPDHFTPKPPGEQAEYVFEQRTIGGIDTQLPSFFMSSSPPKADFKTPSLPSTSDPTIPSDRGTASYVTNGTTNESSVLGGTEGSHGTAIHHLGAEDDDPWSASVEVYAITMASASGRLPTFSLDLTATSNGNRPRPPPKHKKQKAQPRLQQKERKTFLTPAQQAAISASGNKNGDLKSDGARMGKRGLRSGFQGQGQYHSQSKAQGQPPLQPMYEPAWTPVSTASYGSSNGYAGGGKGGRVKVEDPWYTSTRHLEERNSRIKASLEAEVDYGGW